MNHYPLHKTCFNVKLRIALSHRSISVKWVKLKQHLLAVEVILPARLIIPVTYLGLIQVVSCNETVHLNIFVLLYMCLASIHISFMFFLYTDVPKSSISSFSRVSTDEIEDTIVTGMEVY